MREGNKREQGHALFRNLTQEATTTGTPTRGWDYDANNRAVSVWKGASEAAATLRTRWDYDAGGARFRRVDDGRGQAACTTLYLGAVSCKPTRWSPSRPTRRTGTRTAVVVKKDVRQFMPPLPL